MLSFKDVFPMVDFDPPWQNLGSISDTVLLRLSESMPRSSCSSDELEASCRDDSAALTLKLVSIACILIAGAAGIALPLLGKQRKFLRTDSNMFVAAKAFAAGVILATGFVHMLPDGFSSLTDSCLPEYPWSDFPFAGFFAMCSALVTLLADFVGTQIYERRQQQKGSRSNRVGDSGRVDLDQIPISMAVMEKEGDGENGDGRKVFGEEDDGGMHIVGIHAHVAHHRHSHPPGQKGCEGHVIQVLSDSAAQGHSHGHTPVEEDVVDDSGHGDLGHSHMDGGSGEEEGGSRHVVVSQVLELGIVSHSVIIGLSLGVSHSPCTIRPLLGALCFHQFFEGFALGGCISDAQFSTLSTVIMACFFALTTPLGIAVGIGIASSYNSSSARALIIEGVLDSISAGILIYMSLVDLIAADFMSKRMRCNFRLQVMSYLALFLGAGLMSLLAIWA